MVYRAILLGFVIGAAALSTSHAAEWITRPSYFSHNPETGERVTQYAPDERVFVEVRPDYVRSGYRHTHSRIQVAGSADNLHITEEWGRPVRPYGEWQRPFRPFSVPYDLWGPQFIPWGYGPWAHPYGGFHGPSFGGPGFGPDHPGTGPGPDGPGDLDRPIRPRRGDDGFRGTFRRRRATDHEFFWPRPRDPRRSGTPPEPPTSPAPS